MNTFNANSGIQRAICATLASVVTVVAIAVSTLAARPYVLPGQAPYNTTVEAGYSVNIA